MRRTDGESKRGYLEIASQVRTADRSEFQTLLYHRSEAVLEALLEHPAFSEEHLLILLSRKDLPASIISRIARNRLWVNDYRVKLAVLQHPRTPRYIALPLLKFIYVFDLLKIAQSPAIPAELRRLAEDAVLSQKDSLALGQRRSLARQGSLRIAAGLLSDRESSVIDYALSNPRLTEHAVASALLLTDSGPELLAAVAKHPRWPARRTVRLALARSPHLTLGRVMEILASLTITELADFASDRRARIELRAYAARMIASRTRRTARATR
jgi:hypothetical protein